MLDVHLSGPIVGRTLRDRRHDVLAVDQSPELRELVDPELLRLAKEESRILVTSNVGDFMEHVTEWAHAGESHAGIILVAYQVTRGRFGLLIRGIEQLLEGTSQAQWTDRIRWLGLR
jgi:hypothetical protein